MKFPVCYPVTREQRAETGSLETASSSEESGANQTLRGCIPRPPRPHPAGPASTLSVFLVNYQASAGWMRPEKVGLGNGVGRVLSQRPNAKGPGNVHDNRED